MSNKIRNFLKWSLVLLAVWFLINLGLRTALTPLTDPDGEKYLRLTAFSYTLQVAFAATLAVAISWKFSIALGGCKKPIVWKQVLTSGAGAVTLGLILLCMGVIKNRVTWLYKLLFEDDKYGYATVTPSVNSLISVATLVYLMWAIRRSSEKRYTTKALLLIYAIPFVIAGVALYLFDPV